MQREDALWLHKIDIPNEIVVIGMIGKRKGGVDLIAVSGIRIDRPAADHRDAFARNFLDHRRMTRARRTDENSSGDIIPVVAHIFAERPSELFVDARHLIDGAVQHRGQSRAIE